MRVIIEPQFWRETTAVWIYTDAPMSRCVLKLENEQHHWVPIDPEGNVRPDPTFVLPMEAMQAVISAAGESVNQTNDTVQARDFAQAEVLRMHELVKLAWSSA